MDRHVVVTGASGVLGRARVHGYAAAGARVTAVAHRDGAGGPDGGTVRRVVDRQADRADAAALLALEPDLPILAAGRVEREVGPGGRPLPDEVEAVNHVNLVFPALLCEMAVSAGRPLDVVLIGAIADGSPSVFGPVHHAAKAGLSRYAQSLAPLAARAGEGVRIRLYRPRGIDSPVAAGLDNVFVADGSLLPTSLGVNPALTIAALGLWVGRHAAGRQPAAAAAQRLAPTSPS